MKKFMCFFAGLVILSTAAYGAVSDITESPDVNPSKAVNHKIKKPAIHARLSAHPGAAAEGPWHSAGETLDQFKNEIQHLPENCLIQAYIPQVDSSLDADTAAQSLDDLQNHDLFTYWHGNDRGSPHKPGVGPEGFSLYVDGFSNIRLQWPDITAIHCDVIINLSAHGRKKTYQCGILIDGDKKAFVIQCANPEDFSRLVSAFHYWAKSAALGGMPYQAQGLLLSGSGGIKAVWKGSPAGQAGLKVGDTLWGLDQADRRISGDELRERLENLPPGKHGLYVKSEGPNGKTGTKKLELAVP